MRLSTKQLIADMQANNEKLEEQLKANSDKLQDLKNEMYVVEATIARKSRLHRANIVRINFIEDNPDLFK